MSLEILLQQQGRWLAFNDGLVAFSESRPRPSRAAAVLADLEGAVSSVVSLEGSAAHAVALIEKRLRADGLIDGEAKILIHKTRTVGAGYQTLFTAVPLDVWQQAYSWAEAQQDHCLLYPTTSLLLNKLKPGQAVVYQSGRQFTVLALLKHNIICRTSLAYSDDPSDLAMTAGTLGEQFANDLADGEEALTPIKVYWCPALVAQSAEQSQWQDDAVREIFSARSGLAIDTVALDTITDTDGNRYRSGAGWLLQNASPMLSVNPAASRFAYLAEWLLPYASAASIVFAIALGGLGTRWALNASEATENASALNAQVVQIDERIEGMRKNQEIPPNFAGTLKFVDRLTQLQALVDPIAGMSLIRDAAHGEVRILRVRLETPRPNSNPQQQGNALANMDAPTLRVDGVVDTTRGVPGMQVPAFVDRLRRAGYEPIAVEPEGSAAGAGNYFSYLLKSVPATTGAVP
ncbi:hypothetical protein ABB27_07145 [Stenotrophomonas terrae]|uniref:Uncharacterized protein n=1 Tax=Stenotrophomonas terrae TaxID=405446 RepID=A0A0R0CSJ5_9GAMM|nr:hypothetical protein [Stenotrophomonas terrae]KRG68673.1 hypothetical protein ABB27_07145 [Stenotrophomonas terrae]